MTMTPLRCRMIEDMDLAGLAPRSQDLYIRSVRRLAAHYPTWTAGGDFAIENGRNAGG